MCATSPCQPMVVTVTDGTPDDRHLPAINPQRYHDFLTSLSYYVVEKQRTMHGEDWKEEDVQVRFFFFFFLSDAKKEAHSRF